MKIDSRKGSMVMIAFSKKRPLQLRLMLETFNDFVAKNVEITKKVLYKSNVQEYLKLSKEFPDVQMVYEEDFQTDLLRMVVGFTYVLFVVDDTIFTSHFDLKEMCDVLKNWDKILGVSLRLGENTEYCYSMNLKNQIPQHTYFYDDKYMLFDWSHTLIGDFGYPLELSSSLYRVRDISFVLERAFYKNPNELEWAMFLNLNSLKYMPYLACMKTSVAFSNPANRVQNVNSNRFSGDKELSEDYLLELFNQGYKIKKEDFYGFVSNGCHQEVKFNYVKVDE